MAGNGLVQCSGLGHTRMGGNRIRLGLVGKAGTEGKDPLQV